jgi:hypothetical protein
VDVVPRWLVIVEGHARQVVELDEDHGAIDPVIKSARVSAVPDPRETGPPEVPHHLF